MQVGMAEAMYLCPVSQVLVSQMGHQQVRRLARIVSPVLGEWVCPLLS